MRVLYFLFLVAFVGVVGLFAYQNNKPETVTFWDRSWELSFPLIVGGAYLLGMLSGWTVVGMLRRGWRAVAEEDRRRVLV
jgi:lipopolysaccharide assembly protein A